MKEGQPNIDAEGEIAELPGEKKEGFNPKEKLESALGRLKEIINDLASGSRERLRAEHTLSSVEGALANLGKEGAPNDKYAVNVEAYEGNPQEPYTQFEGVPVDELIGILRDSVKEQNKGLPTKEMLAEHKKTVENLDEEYQRESEATEKALKYSKWQEARDALRKMEEVLDLGPSEQAKELEGLADLLEKSSQGYFEAHYTEEHSESADVWTDEERNRQDLRTRHEAKLISEDYRSTGSLEGDYQAGMNVLKYRRELLLQKEREEKEEEEKEKEEEIGPVPPQPVPDPTPVKPIEPEKAGRITIVNAEAQAEFMSRQRGREILNNRLNKENWLKKGWIHFWETGYRNQYAREELKKIKGQENRPGFIRRTLFGASTFEATNKKNLFAGTGEEGQNKEELDIIAKKFAEDLQRESEGEVKQQMENPEINKKINDLVYEFANGTLSEVEFDFKKEGLISEISQKYPEIIAEGGLTADNILEAAKNFRILNHGCNLARMDVNLSVDLGLAKQAIKTEANLTWVDKIISSSQEYIGPGLSPEVIGFAASLGSFFARKPIYWLGGAAGLGGLMGAMRRNVEQKRDLEMHRVERAMGDKEPEGDKPRRNAMEDFVDNMRSSADVVLEVGKLSGAFQASPTKETAHALTVALAEAEARLSLSETRGRDLISFSGKTILERGRFDLLKTLAEAKVSLDKNGFNSDIRSSQEYEDVLISLEGDMAVINIKERIHRYTENFKAGVKGAIGGLVVGGLVQEGFALAGDHIQSLHWLRPGGKATSLESLYHYFKGDMPTTPTGAGMQEILGLSSSKGVIKIDGTTEMIPDKTTGLMDLVDKSDHSRILAKVSIDGAGRVTPVPGSYDPNLINFKESVVAGGTKSLPEWIKSMKGQFGRNVTEDTWHTKGYLDNDTSLPKVEFNELKLFMKYDAKGNLSIDTSGLKEFLQDTAGGQVQGSKHGSSILDVAKEFSDGKIKIGLAPDVSHPTSVLELTYDSGSHKFTAENGADISKFFGIDAKGQPVLKGDGFLGIVHELGARPDGSKNVEWVNAIRGNGEPIVAGERDSLITEIERRNPNSWWGPWMWAYGRKPLEERKEEEALINPEGKRPDFKPKYFEGAIPDEGKDIEGAKITKVTVDTRGQKIGSDKKDWEGEYPGVFNFKDEKQMAEYLVQDGDFFMVPKDREKYLLLKPDDRKAFIESRIKEDREMLEVSEGKGIKKEEIQKIIERVLQQSDKVISGYGDEGRSQLPAKDKIHVLGTLEYQAQTKKAGTNSFGLCFLTSGEIFVNFDLLRFGLSKGGIPELEVLISQLKRTIAHEVTHDAVANNYWMFDAENVDTIPIQRRSGLQFLRRQAKRGQKISTASEQVIIERGRGLNEAITEELAKRIRDDIYKAEGGETPYSTIEPYSAERNILMLLEKKFDIPFAVFAKAAINRKSLRQLAERLNGRSTTEHGQKEEGRANTKVARPQFMSLMMSIMDFEFKNDKYGGYRATRDLINGKKGIIVTKEMKSKFASNLLSPTGGIKPSLAKKYGLIDEEEALKIPSAA